MKNIKDQFIKLYETWKQFSFSQHYFVFGFALFFIYSNSNGMQERIQTILLEDIQGAGGLAMLGFILFTYLLLNFIIKLSTYVNKKIDERWPRLEKND